MTSSPDTRATLKVGTRSYDYWSFASLPADKVARLPYSLKILLENLLRFEDGVNVTRADIEAVLAWDAKATPSYEIDFTPARVIMQDFTGVPCVVDLAAMREAVQKLGGDPQRINPINPAELVIDHSVQVDNYGSVGALAANNKINSNATASVMRSCAGARRRSTISRWCRRIPASSTRSISSISAAWCSTTKPRRRTRRIRTPWSAPIRTPR